MNTPAFVKKPFACRNGAMKTRAVVALAVMLVIGYSLSLTGNVDDRGIFRPFPDDSGKVQTETPFRFLNANNKFFDPSVGTNGQACVTCHQPSDGFTIHVSSIQDAFAKNPNDPLFRIVDTADNPHATTPTYNLIQQLGVIRIGKTIAGTADFSVTTASDSDPVFGTFPDSTDPQHPGAPSLSVFRRPLVNTNVRFDSSVLWDGRAQITDMRTQVKGAIQSLLVTPGNLPVDNPKVDDEIAAFMLGVFTDQVFDTAAGTDATGACALPNNARCGSGSNSAAGATAGVDNLVRLALSRRAPCLFAVNPASPPNLELTPLTPKTCTPNQPGYTTFRAWEFIRPDREDRRTGSGFDKDDGINAGRASVARGEILFNSRTLHTPPDLVAQLGPEIHCTTCHATHNLGNHPDPTFFAREGTDSLDIMSALAAEPRISEMLDRVKMLPRYCMRPKTDTSTFADAACGTHPGDIETTDPGRALVTGKIADVGKFKPPVLRGLAARSPYFHAAAAPDIQALVHFYNARFKIGLTEAEVNDLGAFLEAQ